MAEQPYYGVYENRYRQVYNASGQRWGTAPDDPLLVETLHRWIEDHQLAGKRIIEFACGEGGPGVVFAGKGCLYHGVDISTAALETARTTLAAFPSATVARLDMVRERPDGRYDAAFDCMGLHMLVLDSDRAAYLANAFASLVPGAPMLFYHESHDPNASEEHVASFAEWLTLTQDDYHTPERRTDIPNVELYIPKVPSRARSDEGYRCEFEAAGFIVERIDHIKPGWATIHVRKRR